MDLSQCEFVYFDLEATGLTIPPDVIQIGALSGDGRATFDQYVRPNKHMEESAKMVTGLHTDDDLNLCKTDTGELIPSGEDIVVFSEFLRWLRRVACGKQVILVAYGAFNFDATVLIYHLDRLGLDYKGLIRGFMCLFQYIKVLRTDLGTRYVNAKGRPAVKDLKMTDMMSHFGIDCGEGHHSAEKDADNLRMLAHSLMLKPGEGSLSPGEVKHRFVNLPLYRTSRDYKKIVKTVDQIKQELKNRVRDAGMDWEWRIYLK